MRVSSSVDGVRVTLDVALTPQGLRVTETLVKPGAEIEEVRRGLIETRRDVWIVRPDQSASIVVHLRLCDKEGSGGAGLMGFQRSSIEDHYLSVEDPTLAEPLARALSLFFDEQTVIIANDDRKQSLPLVA